VTALEIFLWGLAGSVGVELVTILSNRADMTKADASRAVDALFGADEGIISAALRKGDRVQITGFGTFARLPRADEVDHADIAVVGVPFDSGVSYRPGARFGPSAIREGSRLLRPYHPVLDVSPFAAAQVVDRGDIAVNPFHIGAAIETLEQAATDIGEQGTKLVTIGGDHTIALPLLRAAAKRHGPIALLHFDAHLDTWDTYFGEPYTHGTPFRRAVEEGILDTSALCHVGIRGPLYGKADLTGDERLGFGIVTAADVMRRGVRLVVASARPGSRRPNPLRRGGTPAFRGLDPPNHQLTTMRQDLPIHLDRRSGVITVAARCRR
jgi:arginase family enzyme